MYCFSFAFRYLLVVCANLIVIGDILRWLVVLHWLAFKEHLTGSETGFVELRTVNHTMFPVYGLM